jgi:predicted kinase
LAKPLRAKVIRSDETRKRMAGMEPRARALDEYKAGLYSEKMSERTYAEMYRQARQLLMEGRSVVLDAAFLKRSDRRAAAALARETGAQFACLLTEAREDAIRDRLGARLESRRDPSDARWEIYVQQKRRFQKPGEVPENRLIKIDTSGDTRRLIKAAAKSLKVISPLSVR